MSHIKQYGFGWRSVIKYWHRNKAPFSPHFVGQFRNGPQIQTYYHGGVYVLRFNLIRSHRVSFAFHALYIFCSHKTVRGPHARLQHHGDCWCFIWSFCKYAHYLRAVHFYHTPNGTKSSPVKVIWLPSPCNFSYIKVCLERTICASMDEKNTSQNPLSTSDMNTADGNMIPRRT